VPLRLGIGKAALSSDDAALLTDKEVKRVELKVGLCTS
jgi:hypothetical protein